MRKNSCIYVCAESLRICGILLQPYIPEKAEALLNVVGVAPDARSFQNTMFGSDANYGRVGHDFSTGSFKLFPPLTSWF